jgi:uncharacterized repeat protein (TIGR03803 family)
MIGKIVTSALTLAAALLLTAIPPAQAQTLTTLYSFTGGADGSHPTCRLVMDKSGNLYGVTATGGLYGGGTVFKVTPAGTETVIYAFGGNETGPESGLTMAGNVLYGATVEGPEGPGTVFQVTKKGAENNLFYFNGSDGWTPWGIPIRGGKGNLYGTTVMGGTYNAGIVYEITPAGTENILYSFTGGSDGGYPDAGVVRDGKGNLYGTTYQGGAYGVGTVFKVSPTGEETVLQSLGGQAGAYPFFAGLVMDTKGNLYGTAYDGGDWGFGTVFEVTKKGTFIVLYSFEGFDGAYPEAGLVLDPDGNVYGTTTSGGAFGQGTMFEVTPTGTETVLYSFTGGADGKPFAGLVRDAQGNLYGTTEDGGAYGYGTVFKLTQ